MKKILLASFVLFMSLSSFAQDVLSKIPKDAVFVSVLKGKEMLKHVPEKELLQYHFTNEFFKEFNQANNFDELGIDLNKSFYYFVTLTDSISYNSFLMPLKSAEKLPNLFNNKEKIKQYGAYKGIASSRDLVLWDNSFLLFVSPFGLAPDMHDYGMYDLETIDATEDAETVVEVVEEEMVVEDYGDLVVEDEVIEDAPPEEVEAPEMVEEEVEEMIMEEVEVEAEVEEMVAAEDESLADRKSQIRHRNRKQELMQAYAMKVLSSKWGDSMGKNPAYLSKVNKKAVMSAWTGNYGEIYSKIIGMNGRSVLGYPRGMTGKMMNAFRQMSLSGITGVESITANLLLAEDNAEVEVLTELTDEMAGYSKQMSNRKFNKDFFRYFDGDKVMGYWGMAVNVENTIDVYPKMVSSILEKVMPEKREEAALGAEFLSIVLDAEEIGELMHGDLMIVVSDVVEKEVKYMSYEYDEDYNATKVEKTKMEPIPEFLMMFSTEKPEFFRKFMALGKKYKVIDQTQKNLYKIETKGSRIPFEQYVVLKDGIFFLASSEYQARDIASGKKGKISRKHRKKAKHKNVIFYANNDAILDAIPTNLFSSKETRQLDFFRTNFKDVELFSSKIKGNTTTSKMKIRTGGSELNALQSFFGMFDQFLME